MDIYNSDYESAKKRAYRILERMPRTEKQLREKLIADNKYTLETIENVIKSLKEYRYIDDRQYSLDYVNARLCTKGLKVLLYELRNKGIDEGLLEEIKETFSDFDPSDCIRKLIIKKKIDPNTSDRKEKERLYRFLLSKGFSYSDISKVITSREE